jgi:hypothetical protein
MLDSGVVDEQVHRSEARDRLLHHGFDRLGVGQVGAVVSDRHPVLAREARAQPFDLG